MSANDVTLKLRAVLDTTEVKQKIEELKRYQNSSQSQNTQKQNTYPVTGNSQVNNGGFQRGLNDSTISRLTSSLNTLQRSIDTLTKRIGLDVKNSNVGVSDASIGGAIASSQKQIPALQKWQDENFRKSLKWFKTMSYEQGKEFYTNTMTLDYMHNSVNPVNKFFAKQFQSRIDKDTPWGNFSAFLNSKEGQEYINGKGQDNSMINKRTLKALGAMVITNGLSQGAQNYTNAGYEKTGMTLGTIAGGLEGGLQIGMGASMMGMSKGAVASLAIAGAISNAVTSLSQMLVQSAEKASRALDNFIKSVDNSSLKIKNFRKDVGFSDWNDRLNGYSREQLTNIRDEKERKLNEAKTLRTDYSDNIERMREVAISRYLEGMNKAGDDTDERAKVERKYKDELEKLTKHLNTLEQNVSEAEKEYKAVSQALEKNVKTVEQMNEIILQSKKFDSQFSDFFKKRKIDKGIKDGDVSLLDYERNDVASRIQQIRNDMQKSGIGKIQDFEKDTNELRTRLLYSTNEEERNSLRDLIKERDNLAKNYKNNAEELMSITSKMDGLENSIEQIKKISENINNSADSIINGYSDTEEMNSVKMKLYGMKYNENGFERNINQRVMFEQSSQILDKYRNERLEKIRESKDFASMAKEEELTLQERDKLLEMSERSKNEADRLGGIAREIESFIGSLGNIQKDKPDMSNVTSLGQYGFNMGEKNDNFNRLERYYQTMEDLSRDIRNKLQEGVKMEASYK